MEIESMLQYRPDKVALYVCVHICGPAHQSILQTFTDSLLKKKKPKPKHFGDTTVKQMGPAFRRELQSSVHFIFSQTGIQHSLQ